VGGVEAQYGGSWRVVAGRLGGMRTLGNTLTSTAKNQLHAIIHTHTHKKTNTHTHIQNVTKSYVYF